MFRPPTPISSLAQSHLLYTDYLSISSIPQLTCTVDKAGSWRKKTFSTEVEGMERGWTDGWTGEWTNEQTHLWADVQPGG